MAYLPYWKRPDGLIFLARQAARKARISSRGQISVSWIEDAAQDVLVRFYEMNEWEQPRNQGDFERFAFMCACQCAASEVSFYRRQKDFDHTNETREQVIDRRYAIHRHLLPTQENYTYFREVMRLINSAPLEIQVIAWRLAQAETLIEYAQNSKISLFEAMAEQRKMRDVLRGLVGDAISQNETHGPWSNAGEPAETNCGRDTK